jgi:hypothetical protein
MQYLHLQGLPAMLILFPKAKKLCSKYYNRRKNPFLKEYLPFEDLFESSIDKENNFIFFPNYLEISKCFVFTLENPKTGFTCCFRIVFNKNKTLSLQIYENVKIYKDDVFSLSTQPGVKSDIQDIFVFWHDVTMKKFILLTDDPSKCYKVDFLLVCSEHVALSKCTECLKDYKILPKRVGWLRSGSWGDLTKYFYDEQMDEDDKKFISDNVTMGEYDEKENTIEVKDKNPNTWRKIKV